MMRFFYFVGEAADAFAAPVDFFAFFFLDFFVVVDWVGVADGAAAVAAGAGAGVAGAAGVVPWARAAAQNAAVTSAASKRFMNRFLVAIDFGRDKRHRFTVPTPLTGA